MDSNNECGEPLDQKSNEDSSDRLEDSEISSLEVPLKQADGLDWEELGEEFRNLFKFNAENRSWWTILKTSLIIFATSLAPSLFDMGTDYGCPLNVLLHQRHNLHKICSRPQPS